MSTPVERSADRKTGSSSTTVTKPTNLVNGDVIGVFVADYDAPAATPAMSGFTLRASVRETTTDGIWVGWFERVVDGSEGSTFAITGAGGSETDWIASRITGVAASGYQTSGSAHDAHGLTASIPSFTTTNTNNLALMYRAGYHFPVDASGQPASWTALANAFVGVDDYYSRGVPTATTVNTPSTLAYGATNQDSSCIVIVVYSDTPLSGASPPPQQPHVLSQAVHRASRW